MTPDSLREYDSSMELVDSPFSAEFLTKIAAIAEIAERVGRSHGVHCAAYCGRQW